MARDTSNDPVVNLPLDYKFDGNGNIIQKVFFGVNAVFCPVWYWWYFKSNRDPNFWVGDSDMDGYDPEECATEFLHRMDNFTPEESCNLFEVAKYCDRMTGVTVFDVVNGRNVNERHLDDYYTGYDLGIEDDDEDEEDDTDIEMNGRRFWLRGRDSPARQNDQERYSAGATIVLYPRRRRRTVVPRGHGRAAGRLPTVPNCLDGSGQSA